MGCDAMIENYLHLRTSYRATLANVKPLQPNYPMVIPSTSGSRFGRLTGARLVQLRQIALLSLLATRPQ